MSTPVTAAALTSWLQRTITSSDDTSPPSLSSQAIVVFQITHSDSGEAASLGEIEQAMHETNTAATAGLAAETLTSRFTFVYRPERMAPDGAGSLAGAVHDLIARCGPEQVIREVREQTSGATR